MSRKILRKSNLCLMSNQRIATIVSNIPIFSTSIIYRH